MSAGDVQGLLPCPFCGSTNVKLFSLDEDCDVVSCDDCNGQGGYFAAPDSTQPEEAIAAWNRRATPSALDGDALAKLIREAEARAEKAEQERDNLADKLELARALTEGAHRRAKDAETRLAAAEAQVQLANYVLQDRLHNRLTPRVVDIAYSAFMNAKRPNNEDGGPSDWATDTYPMVMAKIGEISAALRAHEPGREGA